MSIRTENYCLKREFQFYCSSGGMYSPTDFKTLPQGSYVKPVEAKYVPKHVLEADQWRHTDLTRRIFCHTQFGFVPIPRELLEAK